MKRILPFLRKKSENHTRVKSRLIIWIAILIFMTLTAVDVIFTYYSTVSNVETSIAHQGVAMAESLAESLDRQTYKRFLEDPGYSEDYWSIRDVLNQAREKIAALHVYTFSVDQHSNIARGQIIGMPEDVQGYPIGEVCTIPRSEVKLALQGKTFYTDVLEDKKYGNYLTVGAPIMDGKKIIGYIGIDLSFHLLADIKSKVIQNSILTFSFDVFFVGLLVLTYFILQKWYYKTLRQTVTETEQAYQNEFATYLDTVKTMRHDVMNHIHVLRGLMEFQQYKQAQDYIKDLTTEIKWLDLHKEVKNPALRALLQTKWEKACRHNIDFSIDMGKETFEHLQATDLIKVLSNLIDNALEAVIEHSVEGGKVKVAGKKVLTHYFFEVINTGKTLDGQEQQLIFQKGYSTKQDPGQTRGLGLSIVTNTIDKYGGELRIDSKKGITSFRVSIPVVRLKYGG